MSSLAAFFRALLLLLAITFIEKLVFAGYHADLRAPLSIPQFAGALLDGLRFDLAIAASLALLSYAAAYLISRISGAVFINALRPFIYLSVAVLVLVQGADLLYFTEAGRHLGYEIKEAYNSGAELAGAAFRSYTVPVAAELVFLAFALIAARLTLPVKRPAPRRLFIEKRGISHIAPELQLLSVTLLSVFMIRGGWQPVPLEPLHAQELGDSNEAALALNGAYNALYSLTTPYAVAPVVTRTPTPEDTALVRALYPERIRAPVAPVHRPNVIILFLESWSASYMKSYGAKEETTPFFDDWRKRTFTTREMLAGGHRTTEGLFATLCSAQNPLGATVAQSQLQNYKYDCLPELLRAKGYRTAFFQGTVSGTSGTGPFAQLLGFQESYGKENVTRHRFPYNDWGLHDPDVYAFALDRMAAMPQPFLVGINTDTTHDDQLPPGVKGAFDGSTAAGRYRNVLHFADASLKSFVESVERKFPGTVIIALGDHAGRSEGLIINRYRIPFVIDAPGLVPPGLKDVIASQRDVAPTILDLLGLPRAPWFSGRSLLDPVDYHVADYYDSGTLGWVEDDLGVEISLPTSALHCFDAHFPFQATKCEEVAQAAAHRGLALTTVLQSLLFRGRLKDFAHIRTAQP